MKKTLKKRRKTQIPHNATVIWGKITINSQQNGGFWSPVHFYNYTNALRITGSPKLEREEFNITHLECVEKPNMYTSPTQKLLCGLSYIATVHTR